MVPFRSHPKGVVSENSDSRISRDFRGAILDCVASIPWRWELDDLTKRVERGERYTKSGQTMAASRTTVRAETNRRLDYVDVYAAKSS